MGNTLKLKAIVQGYVNAALGSEKIKAMAHKRAEVCSGCDQVIAMSVSGEKKISIACGRCGCVIAAKTAVPSEACPLGKWREEKV